MTAHERFAEWDAAYVLGALTPDDRLAFEAHLAECARCRAAVAELAGMPGMLGRVQPVSAPRPPADLVDRIARRESSRRSRLRRRIFLAAAAAAVAVVLAVAVPLSLRPTAQTVALHPVVDTAMTVTVSLQDADWGTEVRIDCDYPEIPGDDRGPWFYALVATARDGDDTRLATWNASPGETMTAHGATALPRDDIAALTVTAADGTPLLEADLTARPDD